MKSEEIIAERHVTHGEYSEVCDIAQSILESMMKGTSWTRLDRVQKTTLQMIAHKIGRAVSGDPSVEDHWRDIEGYAKLVADRIKQMSEVPSTS